jgi:Flp pilus assembly pilin Flp
MLLLGLIAVVCLVGVAAFGGHLQAAYEIIRAAIARS